MDTQVAQPPRQEKQPSLWRNRDYMILWSGQTVSSLGSSVSNLALPLLILALTNSPAQAGFAGFLATLPYVIFSLPAGALVDRWDRRRVMILCDLGRFVVYGSIPLAYGLGHLSLLLIYVAVTVHGVLFTFFNLAEVAALPRVVPKQQLPTATSQNQASDIASFLVGPPLGGFLFQVVGKTVPFLADSLSYLGSVISLLFIRTRFQQGRTAARRSLRVEIGEGMRWLWNEPLIRFIAFLTGGTNFVFSGTFLLVILIAKHQGASPTVIGAMYTIGAAGGIVGSVIAPYFQRRFSFAQVIIATVWFQALLFPLLAVAPNPVVIGLIGAGLFMAGPIYNAVQLSYRLSIIPDELQGRVNSVFRLLAFGFQPLGAGLVGLFAQWFGLTRSVLIFAACLVLLAVATALNPHVRHAR